MSLQTLTNYDTNAELVLCSCLCHWLSIVVEGFILSVISVSAVYLTETRQYTGTVQNLFCILSRGGGLWIFTSCWSPKCTNL